ncbi:hypothetical protein EG329_004911 [Mollisiaceae sp. DMI_Dod_QoI]|nr:hypothetical protein EG329_004911 [Helotiales sp. DMI_Dod_QoI]
MFKSITILKKCFASVEEHFLGEAFNCPSSPNSKERQETSTLAPLYVHSHNSFENQDHVCDKADIEPGSGDPPDVPDDKKPPRPPPKSKKADRSKKS